MQRLHPLPHPSSRNLGQSARGMASSLMLALAASAALMASATAQAAVQLHCQVDVNGLVRPYTFVPVADPYSAVGVDIDGRFRFKAVVVGQDSEVSYVNIYTYYTTRRQPMILSAASHQAPKPGPASLTGQVAVYSPELGKELQYNCQLVQGTP